MEKLVKLEELGMFVLSLVLFSTTGYQWWWIPLLLFVPDLSMAGYLVNPKAGAGLYNLVHHKGVAIIVYIAGYYYLDPTVQMIGIILFAHSSLDRLFGYGLKFSDAFRHTHLGWIGEEKHRA